MQQVMILSTHPLILEIVGAKGVALDLQVVSSTYLGPDQFGVDRFDTVRSAVGEALFLLKYRQDRTQAADLAETAWDFIKRRPSTARLLERIVTTPPSDSSRSYQPVEVVAEALSALSGIPRSIGDLEKVKHTPPMKDVRSIHEKRLILQDAFKMRTTNLQGKHVLVLDDLFDTGSTTQFVVDALLQQGGAASVRVLALTRTRKRK